MNTRQLAQKMLANAVIRCEADSGLSAGDALHEEMMLGLKRKMNQKPSPMQAADYARELMRWRASDLRGEAACFAIRDALQQLRADSTPVEQAAREALRAAGLAREVAP